MLQTCRSSLSLAPKTGPSTRTRCRPSPALSQKMRLSSTNSNFPGVDGYLYCDNLRVDDIREQVAESPFYLYSKNALSENYAACKDLLGGITSMVGHAVRENSNPFLLKNLQQLGSGAMCTSGADLRLALKAGFNASKIILNASGALLEEVEVAARQGMLINVASEFDMAKISTAAKRVGLRARILLTVDPDICPPAIKPSSPFQRMKPEIERNQLKWFLHAVATNAHLELVGIHCDFRSHMAQEDSFWDAALTIREVVLTSRAMGLDPKHLHLGGGQDVMDCSEKGDGHPTPDRTTSFQGLIEALGLCLIVEPGRPLVSASGALISTVLGCQSNGSRELVMVDGSIASSNQLAFRGSDQGVELTAPSEADWKLVELFGQAGEPGDLMAEPRLMQMPERGNGLAAMDTGAYSLSRTSFLNHQTSLPEYWVEDGCVHRIQSS